MIGSLDPTATRYIEDVRDAVSTDLGSDLVGFYLYGSSVSGQFVRGQSDLDAIAVVGRWLPPGRVRRTLGLIRAVQRPCAVKGLDLWIVPLDSARAPRPDPGFECWVLSSIGSELIGGEHHPGDARLVLLFQMCRDHGFALAGPPPWEVFGELDRAWVIDAMRVDLTLRGAAGWYRVLNACRTVYFLDEGVMCGKLEGAAWYRSRATDPWLVDAALAWRRTGSGPPMPPERVDEFVGAVLARLSSVSPRRVPAGVPSAERGPTVIVGREPPLVTCVMTAPASPELLALAARRFARQDWPDRELVVLRPPGAAEAEALPLDPRVRAVELPQQALHAWRAAALAEARGSVLAVWDPLTWYADDRLTQQVHELLSTSVPRLVSPSILAIDPLSATTRRVTDREALERTTLVAHRHAWIADHAASRLGERHGVAVLVDAEVALRRGDPADPADALALVGDHLEAYAVALASAPPPGTAWPAVSCLMPTYNRRRFVARAIGAFLDQDYPNRELVILDDGEDPVGDLVPQGAPVRYHRLAERATIGRKRQLLCGLAEGDLLVQWDDDDWYAPSRVRRQVAPLVTGAADIAGILHSFLVDTQAMRFWRGELPLHEGRLHAVIVAGTLAFTRAAWQGVGSYPDRSIGEEVALLEAVIANDGRVAPIVNNGIYICVRHGGNSWRLQFDSIEGPPGWREIAAPDFLPQHDLDFYRSLSGGAR
jgi:hypothetical protein